MNKKNRLIKTLAALLATLLLSVSFVSCSDNDKDNDGENQETVFYTVKFDTVGGSEIASMKVPSGTKISPPDTPTKPNHIFVEWRKGALPWDFTENPVSGDMTLSAIWISADSVFETKKNEDGETVTVTGIKQLPSNALLEIPEKIGGYTVTAIGDGAFASFASEYITAVSLPESIVSVGDYAFEAFPVALTVKGALSHIGEGAFMGASALKNIKLSEGMDKIPFSAFSGTSIGTIIIPEGVSVLEEDAFKDCSSLKTLVLPKTADTVENSAFHGCLSLKTVFFKGNSDELDNISVADMNENFTNAKVYFFSVSKPESTSDKWYFDSDGIPRVWQ